MNTNNLNSEEPGLMTYTQLEQKEIEEVIGEIYKEAELCIQKNIEHNCKALVEKEQDIQ